MFSGIGGFELGISAASRDVFGDETAECVGYSEIEKNAVSIYRKHFWGNKNYGDATGICWDNVGGFDMLVGGFPCQDFSTAGKGRGLEGSRGTLFFEIARCLGDKRPRYFLLENVKGLFGCQSGEVFSKILGIFAEYGYHVQWALLNTKDFGLPQNRERVFFVGYLGGEPSPEIFPLRRADFADIQKDWLTKEEPSEESEMRLRKVGSVDQKGHNSIWGRVYDPAGVSANINANAGGVGAKTGLYAIGSAKPIRVTAGVNVSGKVRRLTPIECERLQGFTDNFTAIGVNEFKEETKISDTQRYRVLGNAVSVNVIEAIMIKFFKMVKLGGR